jgi:hypothetical protein
MTATTFDPSRTDVVMLRVKMREMLANPNWRRFIMDKHAVEICLQALDAIAMEAREGRDGETRLDAKHDSAGPQDIAQSQPSPTGDQR